jgi:hypothetical protein
MVTPIDALMVINYLNSGQPRQLAGSPTGPPFWDVHADGFVTPLDALTVINYLNQRHSGSGEGEGGSGGWAGTVGESEAGRRPGAQQRAALPETAGSDIVSLSPIRHESDMPWGTRRQRRVHWFWDVWSGHDLSNSVGRALEWPLEWSGSGGSHPHRAFFPR